MMNTDYYDQLIDLRVVIELIAIRFHFEHN